MDSQRLLLTVGEKASLRSPGFHLPQPSIETDEEEDSTCTRQKCKRKPGEKQTPREERGGGFGVVEVQRTRILCGRRGVE